MLDGGSVAAQSEESWEQGRRDEEHTSLRRIRSLTTLMMRPMVSASS